MRLVLDTDVMLSGLMSRMGASRVILIAAWEGVVTPLVSLSTLLEYEAVLKRPGNLIAMGLSRAEVDRFLDQWTVLAERVEPHFSWRPSIRDPDDELFVDVALNGAADMIVTFNLRDFRPADDRNPGLGIPVGRPGDVLGRLEWRPSATSLSAFRHR